jgi:hypothetical protein
MGEYFTLKSHLLIYEYILGKSSTHDSSHQEKLNRNAARFSHLPQKQQENLLNNYGKLTDRLSRSWKIKMLDGLHVLFFDIPSFELAWLFFSVIIAILLLMRIEGAAQAAWLLPVIVLAYGIDNQLNGSLPSPSPDLFLFPTDMYLQQHYILEPLKTDLTEQKQQWMQGWHAYLVDQWTTQSSDVKTSIELVEEGEFNFNLGRLQILQSHLNWKKIFHEKIHYFYLSVYLIWNLLFAWCVNRRFLPSSKQLAYKAL